MGKALISKWIYNYTNCKDASWGKVVCTKSKRDSDSLLSTLRNMGNNSVLLSFVDSTLGRNDRDREVVNNEFRIIIGEGQDTDFWCNNWMGLGEL